jgi:hypothetical protein
VMTKHKNQRPNALQIMRQRLRCCRSKQLPLPEGIPNLIKVRLSSLSLWERARVRAIFKKSQRKK